METTNPYVIIPVNTHVQNEHMLLDPLEYDCENQSKLIKPRQFNMTSASEVKSETEIKSETIVNILNKICNVLGLSIKAQDCESLPLFQ